MPENLPPLRDVISRYNLRAEKSLGQNFLLDPNITDKIVRGCPDLDGTTIFEIGPGPGGLTRSLLQSKAKKIIAIEFDARAVTALQELQGAFPGRLEIHHGDALQTDLLALAPPPRAIIANLPYNIATKLLIGWLAQIRGNPDAYEFMALMFQREVAERILAGPRTKAYGRLSVISQWLCAVRKIYDLPPSAFTPPPKVKSAIVHFTPHILEHGAPSFSAVETLTGAAFGQRRKMIRTSLQHYLPVLQSLGIPETARAEELSVDQFLHIAKNL